MVSYVELLLLDTTNEMRTYLYFLVWVLRLYTNFVWLNFKLAGARQPKPRLVTGRRMNN
jgi:hypothetical protein